MYNFFKNILGIPDSNPGSGSENDLRNDFRNPIWGSDDYSDDDEDFRSHPGGDYGSFGFPIVTDPIEIHRFFENQMDQMLQRFGMFGTQGYHKTWEDENITEPQFPPIEDGSRSSGNLRDSFLRTPGYVHKDNQTKEDTNLDGKVSADDIKNFLEQKPGPSQTIVPVEPSSPKVFSKSIMIRTIRRPDGSVETVRKVRDHTGKEETTVTHDMVDPQQPDLNPINPISPVDPADDASMFRKFFGF